MSLQQAGSGHPVAGRAQDAADRRVLLEALVSSQDRAGSVRFGAVLCATLVCLVASVAVALFPTARDLQRRNAATLGAAAAAGRSAPETSPAAPSAGSASLPAVTHVNRQLTGPGSACCWAKGGDWESVPHGGYPDFRTPAASSTDPNAWFEWSLGAPTGGRRWDRLKIRVWIPDTQASASVRYTVTTSQANGSEVRSFDVAQQDYQGWYELAAIFSIGTPDRRTGSVWVRVTYPHPADGSSAAQCPGGFCPSMAASQVEFAWS